MRPATRSLWVASAATLLALAWQVATIHSNYAGNWTALFCIGGQSPMPAELESGAWIFEGSKGYDGQYYRVVAHDPWMQTDARRFVDGRHRYDRILLPGAAWLLAFGQQRWIDTSYILLVMVSLFVGTWFTAMWAMLENRAVWCGFGFLLLPGVVITLNRMTVDITEYACVAAALYFWRRGFWIGCWIAGAAAFLTRDLGLILIAALVGMSLLQRAWRRSALFATAAIPAALWILYVSLTIRSHHVAHAPTLALIPIWAFRTPLLGAFLAIVNPQNYPLAGWLKTVTQCLDGIAIAAVAIAALAAVAEVRRRPFRLESSLCILYAALFLMTSARGFWTDTYSYPRAFSPLLGLIAWQSMTSFRAWAFLPWLSVLLRVCWQLGPQVIGIFHSVVA
jgi:hypothetical protein